MNELNRENHKTFDCVKTLMICRFCFIFRIRVCNLFSSAFFLSTVINYDKHKLFFLFLYSNLICFVHCTHILKCILMLIKIIFTVLTKNKQFIYNVINNHILYIVEIYVWPTVLQIDSYK